MLHIVGRGHARQLGDGLLFLPLAVGGVNHGGVQHPTGPVYYGHLTAVSVSGVQPHRDLALHRRLHQKRLEIQGKLPDGALAGAVGQKRPHLPLQRRQQQAVIGVLRRRLYKLHRRGAGTHHRPAQHRQRQLPVHRHAHAENALPLAPVHGQHLMALHPAHGLLKLIVQTVNGVLLHGGAAHQPPLPQHQLPQAAADGGVVADPFGDDVARACQRILRGVHAPVRIDELPGGVCRGGAVPLLVKEKPRQRLQPLLPGDNGAGAPLLLIGPVKVLHLRQCLCRVDGGGQFLRELSLPVDGGLHRLPPVLQAPQVLQPLVQRPQRGVVHGAVLLLAVAGDERNGAALVDQLHHVFHILRLLPKLRRKLLYDRVHSVRPLVVISDRAFRCRTSAHSSHERPAA